MDPSFFSSATGVAIAWVCTVVSCGYAFFQKSQITKIKLKFESLNVSSNDLKVANNYLTIERNKLKQKITDIENTEICDNYQKVNQTGKKNINQGVVKGDVNIDLS